MQTLIFIAIEAMVIGIAVRILLLARRTGGTPEKLIGTFFLSIALMILARMVGSYPEVIGNGFATAAVHLGNALFCGACVVLFFFTQRLFRPDAAWARALTWTGSAAATPCAAGSARNN